MEETQLDVEYPLNESMNFGTDYFNLIPSATISYQLKPAQTLKLGYNMRIQRPGIWYLNPYVNTSDPKYISQGNSGLDVEKSHNFSLNYSLFNQKFNFNANAFYNFMNNSIQRVTTIEDNDISYSTYENIGNEKIVGLYVYGSWNPITPLRINLNASGNYTDIRANNNSGLANHGFGERLFGGIQYTFPYDITLSLNGGFSSPYIRLEGSSSGYNYTSIGLSKNFLNKKLNVSLRGSDIFYKNKEYSSERETPQFYYKNVNHYPGQSFRISLSYQFGEMKQQIQKIRRGISNEDTKSGESGGEGGGSGKN